MFEGVPSYPDASRLWQIVDELQVTQFYTAPTAIRALMRDGDDYVTRTSRKSLRVLGSVGEPINPSAWQWYHDVVGGGRCPIMDTWWQTETGGHLIAPLLRTQQKPGSATLPFFGVEPVLVDTNGVEINGTGEGLLCIRQSWPGMMRTILDDHERFIKNYFGAFKGLYFSGDGARRDADGDYWITGRVDDVINVSGHRIGTAEVEAALNMHDAVAESAVVAMPHDIKGQGIFAYIVLRDGVVVNDTFAAALRAEVQQRIGALAKPDEIRVVPGLPKTRSGKIMRRILRKIAENDFSSLGDISTLADPGVVEEIIKLR
jgi:acetyl-CoA synthetase